MAAGMQFGLITLLYGGSGARDFPQVALMAIVFSPVVSWMGVAASLPITIVGGLAVRCHWLPVVVIYGFVGWLIMWFLYADKVGNPFYEPISFWFWLSGVIPAAAYGLVIWQQLMCQGMDREKTGAGGANCA